MKPMFFNYKMKIWVLFPHGISLWCELRLYFYYDKNKRSASEPNTVTNIREVHNDNNCRYFYNYQWKRVLYKSVNSVQFTPGYRKKQGKRQYHRFIFWRYLIIWLTLLF